MPPDPSHCRILVVDDDEELRNVLGKLLARAGYEVTLASCGGDALARIGEDGRYALVLTDVRMPDMSGPALVMRLRRDYALQPAIVFMSGASDAWLDSMRSLGARFLKKPFMRTELLGAIEAALPHA